MQNAPDIQTASAANRFRIRRMLLLAVIAITEPAHAAPESCEVAAGVAATEYGVPADLMRAIALAETGRRIEGVLRPWPWAVNEGGKGQWFATRVAAETYAQTAIAAGVSNIDIGCFQLNHRWHGQAFRSVSDMFDPIRNARHAAAFLTDLYRETGDWHLAAGAYHSRTPDLAQSYSTRVANLRNLVPVPAAVHVRQANLNAFPLLQAGGPGSTGSLVPDVGANRPLLNQATTRLIGG